MERSFFGGTFTREYDVYAVDGARDIDYTDYYDYNEFDETIIDDVLDTDVAKTAEENAKKYIEYIVATKWEEFDFAIRYEYGYRTFKEDWGWERELTDCKYIFVVDDVMPTDILDEWNVPYVVERWRQYV